jgi:hypothetical protein
MMPNRYERACGCESVWHSILFAKAYVQNQQEPQGSDSRNYGGLCFAHRHGVRLKPTTNNQQLRQASWHPPAVLELVFTISKMHM